MKQSFVIGGFLLAVGTAGCLDLKTSTEGTAGGTTGGSSSSSSGSGGTPGALIQEWAATDPGGIFEYTLPPWLHIECTSGNRTSQWSQTSMRGPYGINAARPRNIGKGWGLSVENRRRNHVQNSDSWDGPNWNNPAPISAMVKTLGQPDPAGGNAATKFTIGPVRRSHKAPVPEGVSSAWFRGGTDSEVPMAYFVLSTATNEWTFKTLAGIPEWTRLYAGVGAGELFLDTVGNNQSGATAINNSSELLAYAAQHETDGNGGVVRYASSYIPTLDKVGTRNEDSLYSDSANTLLPGGYFHTIIRIAPNYSSFAGSALVHHLLYLNTTNQLRIDLSKGTVTLEGSSSLLTGPNSGMLAWVAETELTIEAKVTPMGRYLKVSGADTGNFEVSDAEDRPWPASERLYILGDTSGAQECADLRYIGFIEPN